MVQWNIRRFYHKVGPLSLSLSLSPSRELNKSTEDKMSNITMIAKMTPNSEYLNYFKIIIENVNNFYVGKLIGKNFLQLN